MSVTLTAATLAPTAEPVILHKQYLTELELFKMCIVHPRYTKAIMEKYGDMKEKMRVYRKVWSALTKYLKNQCFEKSRCTDIP